MYEKVKANDDHLLLANEISEKIICELEPYQQREFIERLNENIRNYYTQRIDDLEKDLCTLKNRFEGFLNIDK